MPTIGSSRVKNPDSRTCDPFARATASKSDGFVSCPAILSESFCAPLCACSHLSCSSICCRTSASDFVVPAFLSTSLMMW